MNAIIILSILALVVLYLGVFNAKKAVLPVTLLGLVAALGLTLTEWNTNAQPIFTTRWQSKPCMHVALWEATMATFTQKLTHSIADANNLTHHFLK